MTFQVSLFIVHVAAFCGFIVLYRTAPCWMQKIVMGGMILGAAFISIGYAISAAEFIFPSLGWYGAREFWLLGLVTEHISVMMYVFRLLYQQYKKRAEQTWENSSTHYRNSLG